LDIKSISEWRTLNLEKHLTTLRFDIALCTQPPAAFPVLVMELDGPEHRTDKDRIENDVIKNAVCLALGLPLLRIPLGKDIQKKSNLTFDDIDKRMMSLCSSAVSLASELCNAWWFLEQSITSIASIIKSDPSENGTEIGQIVSRLQAWMQINYKVFLGWKDLADIESGRMDDLGRPYEQYWEEMLLWESANSLGELFDVHCEPSTVALGTMHFSALVHDEMSRLLLSRGLSPYLSWTVRVSGHKLYADDRIQSRFTSLLTQWTCVQQRCVTLVPRLTRDYAAILPEPIDELKRLALRPNTR